MYKILVPGISYTFPSLESTFNQFEFSFATEIDSACITVLSLSFNCTKVQERIDFLRNSFITEEIVVNKKVKST